MSGLRPPTAHRGWRYFALGNWALLDQALSSGTNFLLAVVVVRSVSTEDFGAFSIVVVVYVIAIGVSRSLTTEPLAIQFGRDVDAILERAPMCLGFALGAGCVFGAGCVVAATSTSGALSSALLVLGLTFPLLIVQDAGRVTCFAMGSPRRAVANDAVWAVLELPLVAVVVSRSHAPIWQYIAAWLLPGAIAGLLILYQLSVRPSLRHAGAWFRGNRRLATPLVWNYGLTAAPPYVLFALTPLVASLFELGIARTAYLPYGVFGVIFQSAWLVLLPAASRRKGRDLARLAVVSSAVLGSVALTWVILVSVVMPGRLGVALFGDGWAETGGTRLVFGAALVAQAVGVGPFVALRALEVPSRLVRIRLVTAPTMVLGGLLLTAELGAIGLAVAVMFGDLATTCLSWAVFPASNRRLGVLPPPVVTGVGSVRGSDAVAFSSLPPPSAAGNGRTHETVPCSATSRSRARRRLETVRPPGPGSP
jgi:hypothetical protein